MVKKVEGLEFYTTEDLIKEIINRTTFQGIILQAENDCKNKNWRGKKTFKIHWNENLTKKEVIEILQSTAESL